MVDNLLAEAAKTRPAAVVLDVLNPDIQIWTACLTLRSHEKTRNVPILPVAFAEDGHAGLVLGPADFLKQPCLAEEFGQALLSLTPWISYKEALVIDPDADAANRWATFLGDDGYETTIAQGAEAGIRHLQNLLPGVILLNLNLTPADLVRVTTFIRSQNEMATIPLLCILPVEPAAYDQRALQEQLLQSLKTQKFPVSAFIRQLKRFFAHLTA